MVQQLSSRASPTAAAAHACTPSCLAIRTDKHKDECSAHANLGQLRSLRGFKPWFRRARGRPAWAGGPQRATQLQPVHFCYNKQAETSKGLRHSSAEGTVPTIRQNLPRKHPEQLLPAGSVSHVSLLAFPLTSLRNFLNISRPASRQAVRGAGMFGPLELQSLLMKCFTETHGLCQALEHRE